MKKFLLTEALLLMLTSCGGNSGLETLGEVESYISDEPERVLDKNYIDVADDSLINVAVEWYSRRGDADGPQNWQIAEHIAKRDAPLPSAQPNCTRACIRLSLLLHAALDSRRRNCRIATPLSFPPSVLILHSRHVPASETAGLHLSRLFPPARRNCCSPPSRPPTIKIIQKNY